MHRACHVHNFQLMHKRTAQARGILRLKRNRDCAGVHGDAAAQTLAHKRRGAAVAIGVLHRDHRGGRPGGHGAQRGVPAFLSLTPALHNHKDAARVPGG